MRSSIAVALLWTGCQAGAAPEKVLDTYFTHLRAGRIARAYALTSARYRASHDLTRFALDVARQPVIEASSMRRGELTLRVELTNDARPAILRGPSLDRLRLNEDPLDFYDTRSPEATLRSFSRAVRYKRHAQLWSLVAASLGQRWLSASRDPDEPFPPEILQLAALLEDQLDRATGLRVATLTETEDQARVELEGGRVVGLTRTTQGWRIADLP